MQTHFQIPNVSSVVTLSTWITLWIIELLLFLVEKRVTFALKTK